MRYASVCSGVEAASLAWGKLGWTPVFFAEVEPFPCAVLQQRFNATKPLHPLDPAEATDEKDRKMRESWLKQINKLPDTGTIPNLGDFTKIKGEDYVGAIDLLVGGTPCQDLSVAGKRAGFGDIEKRDEDNAEKTRSSLALDFVRLAYEARCKYFVWKNVPGVFSSNRGRDFATLLSMFCGYTVDVPKDGWKSSGIVQNRRPDRYGLAWRVLDAQFTRVPGFPFAVPQRRRRVFLVGCLGDWERAASILLEPDRLSWDTPPRIKTREILAGGAGDCAAKTVNRAVEFAQDCANTVEASCYKGPCGTWNERTIVSQFWNGEDVAGTVTCSSNNALEPDKGRLQAVVANGTSFGGRDVDEISGPVTTHESGVRGDTKLVFTLDADRSNSMKSANPSSGIHEADVAKTLDTTVPTPQKAQGGQMIVHAHETGQGFWQQGDVSGTIRCEGENRPSRPSNIVCFHGSQDTITNETHANVIGRNGGLENCICFQQNTRDEVRKMNGDGEIAGALAAEPGMKQQNYVCYDARGNGDGVTANTIAGDHNNRVTDYTPIVQNAVAIAENVIGRKVENGGNGIGAQDELAYTQNATGVMGVCTKGNSTEEIDYGNAEKNRPSEILRVLRNALGEKTFSEWLGRHGSVSQEEILQPEMHGSGVRCEAEQDKGDKHLPLSCEETCPARQMRNLWKGECPGRASQGRRLHEQQPIESDADMQELSHQGTSPAEVLCNMWQTIQGAWLLHEAFREIQKVRQSASVQAESVRYNPCRTVRRLTPLEAERLMSFPDNHTRIAWNGKPEDECPDAPRYKAAGNSMCVNCMEWIGRRIEEFDE